MVMMIASTSLLIATLLALLHTFDAFNFPSRRLKPSHSSPHITSAGGCGCTDGIRSPSSLSVSSSSSSSSSSSPQVDITSTATTSSSVYANSQQSMDRSTAQTLVDQTLCPKNEERDRNTAAMEAYQGTSSAAITNDDPRSEYTYGEFPYESFDLLVDRALDFVNSNNDGNRSNERTLLDLGSGSGRLVFYAALTRGGEAGEWDVHGIEIGTQFHSLAVNSLQRGVDNGWFVHSDAQNAAHNDDGQTTTIALHNGNALLVDDPYYNLPKVGGGDESTSTHSTIQSLLSKTDILFAYSTVWETNSAQPFNPELQAMILSPKWSQTLAAICSNGCVAITTDRALNPEDGWRLVDRMDVENPSVWGSVGYISVLEK